MSEEDRIEVALWKLSVLGPLVSARLEHGDRLALCQQIAERVHERPGGRAVRISPRTVESWLYAYRRGGLEALKPGRRSDRGCARAIAPVLTDLVVRCRREQPRRSIRRIIAMLEREGLARVGELSRSSVHRLLVSVGISGRPRRGPSAERRSFLPEHAGDLWMGDVMHGPIVIAPDGRLRKSYLITQLDAATRYLPHSYFALSEDARAHEYGMKQALLKSGRPRTYYVDLGAAYVARSLRVICADLGIHLLHTAPRDCEAKGAIERWHRTWRDEVGDELPTQPIALDQLNAIHWAWLGSEYHARVHTTTGLAPRRHWLDQVAHLRTLPAGIDLDEVFLHRAVRKVRKDATVRFAGKFLEVRAELTGKRVELRYDPHRPDGAPRVFVSGHFFCDTVPLDRIGNSMRHRRRDLGHPDPASLATGIDPLAQIQQQHYQRTAPARRRLDSKEK